MSATPEIFKRPISSSDGTRKSKPGQHIEVSTPIKTLWSKEIHPGLFYKKRLQFAEKKAQRIKKRHLR